MTHKSKSESRKVCFWSFFREKPRHPPFMFESQLIPSFGDGKTKLKNIDLIHLYD